METNAEEFVCIHILLPKVTFDRDFPSVTVFTAAHDNRVVPHHSFTTFVI
jgi:prolyl oligopeptidase PreP (S9A serine peptidase family)